MGLRIVNIIAWILLVVGGLNWLLIGFFDWNLVQAVFVNATICRIIYSLVGLSAIWLLITPLVRAGRISLWDR